MTEAPFEPLAVRDWGFPRAVTGVALLVEHGRDRGVADELLLAGADLAGADLTGSGEVTAAQELRVVRNLRGVLGEVGAEVGRRYRAADFGAFGYALVSSRTVLDAMNVALRFLDLSHAFALPTAELDGQRVRIVVDGSTLPRDVRRFLLERDSAAIRAVLAELGTATAPGRRRGDRVELSLPVAELDRPLSHADPAALATGERVCRTVVERRRSRGGLPGDARVLITQQLPVGAPMPAVAAALGVTERTLRRRLAADGTSYQRLLDEVRESLAVELLDRLPVQDVAVRLGYAEASSFVLAFRRWTGRTPGSVQGIR